MLEDSKENEYSASILVQFSLLYIFLSLTEGLI